MATRKKQQLDIALTQIKDIATRDALSSIVTFVNQLTQSVVTGGDVKGAKVKNHAGTAGFNEAGLLIGAALNLNKGGAFRTKLIEGSLAAYPSGAARHYMSGLVFGAIGLTQFNGTSEWAVMSNSAGGNNQNVFYDPSLALGLSADYTADAYSVTIINADASHTNAYRAIVFYR